MFSTICLAGIIIGGFFVRPISDGVDLSDFAITALTDELYHFPQFQTEQREGGGEVLSDANELVYEEFHFHDEAETDVYFIVLTILVIIILALFIFAIYLFKSYRRDDADFDDFDEMLEESTIDHEVKQAKRKKSPRNANYTIRRMFKRKVREYIHTKNLKVTKSDTPELLAKSIEQWEDIDALKDMYQQVRYGEDG